MNRLNYEKKDLGPSFATTVAVMLVSSLVLGFIFDVEASGWEFWLMQALFTLFIGASAVLYAVITKTNIFTATKINKAPKYAHILWGFLAVIFLIACMTPINTALLDGIEVLGLKRPSVNLEENLAGLLIVACLLPAICEEVVFRGTVAQSLANNSNKLGVIVLNGVLFAVFHANPAQTVHQFVLGAFLTLLVFRSGSLWTSVIVHLFNNVLVVVLSFTPIGAEEFWSFKSNTAVVVICLVVGVVGFGLSVFGYIKTTKSVWYKDTHIQTVLQSANTPDNMQQSNQDTIKQSDRNIASVVTLIVAIVVCVILWVANLFAK